jgi:bifunctional non-homologous end joining protein LigD
VQPPAPPRPTGRWRFSSANLKGGRTLDRHPTANDARSPPNWGSTKSLIVGISAARPSWLFSLDLPLAAPVGDPGAAFSLTFASVPLDFIRPCSPTTTKTVPVGDAWLHEPKLDGYRMQVIKEGHRVRLYSRRGNEWTDRLPKLITALADITCRSAIIDAELCMPGAGGVPNFHGLPSAMKRTQQQPLTVFAFDLLHRDGKDLLSLPLTARRQRLERLLARSDIPSLRLVEAFADGVKLLALAERFRLEGIVSKRKLSPYRSGPSRDWLKTKTATWRAANRERWRLFERG